MTYIVVTHHMLQLLTFWVPEPELTLPVFAAVHVTTVFCHITPGCGHYFPNKFQFPSYTHTHTHTHTHMHAHTHTRTHTHTHTHSTHTHTHTPARTQVAIEESHCGRPSKMSGLHGEEQGLGTDTKLKTLMLIEFCPGIVGEWVCHRTATIHN